MQPPTEAEARSVRELLDASVITSRAALLVVLLGSDTGSIQMGPLADKLGMSIPRVSMLGDTLVDLRLVDRCVPVSDHRKVSLALTQAGYGVAWSYLHLLRGFSGASADCVVGA